jgi:hypothetical protein
MSLLTRYIYTKIFNDGLILKCKASVVDDYVITQKNIGCCFPVQVDSLARNVYHKVVA